LGFKAFGQEWEQRLGRVVEQAASGALSRRVVAVRGDEAQSGAATAAAAAAAAVGERSSTGSAS